MTFDVSVTTVSTIALFYILFFSFYPHRFRRYYRHVLSLGFLKQRSIKREIPSGVVLASALALQVGRRRQIGLVMVSNLLSIQSLLEKFLNIFVKYVYAFPFKHLKVH